MKRILFGKTIVTCGSAPKAPPPPPPAPEAQDASVVAARDNERRRRRAAGSSTFLSQGLSMSAPTTAGKTLFGQ